MKIIQIMPEFGLAGAEIMCENLIYELIELGNEVIVVSLYDYHSAITERLEANNIKIFYLNKKGGLDISMISKLFKIFKQEKPDVIHTHLYVMQYAIPAAILAKIKCRVHTIHNIAQKENGKLARKLNKLFYKFAGVIPVALSNEIKKTVEKEYNLLPNKIPVIFNGIDFRKCIMKEDYKINNKMKILHIGRFSKQKNHLGLITAFEQFHNNNLDCELQLIGSGEKKEEIEQIVNEKGLKESVFFLRITRRCISFFA